MNRSIVVAIGDGKFRRNVTCLTLTGTHQCFLSGINFPLKSDIMSGTIIALRSKIKMKIGEISSETGVSVRMIRHFESLNLLRPNRQGTYRTYSAKDIELIRRIKELQSLGLPLKQIKDTLKNEDAHLEKNLLSSFSRNHKQIKDLEAQNQSILESLQSVRLNSSKETLIKEGIIMEFVKSFEEVHVVRGRMPYLEVLYETFVNLSRMHWGAQTPIAVLHSTDLWKIHEGIKEAYLKDLKVLVSSEEQQFRNAFLFSLSPELIKTITGKEVDLLTLEDDKESNLKITNWVSQAIKTFNHAWNATFTTVNLENHGMLKENSDLENVYHDDEIFILTNMYTEGEKERFSIGLPYRYVSIIYNLLKR
ncbi:MAG: MerR family transcriptional regulator [Oligoflexia bacterium]|nr:MerR family transcriptional regulator [Oligoflexia bacterium]